METVNSIRLAVRGKRHALNLSQEQVAERAGVSRKWLSEFEQGKVNVELGLVLRLLEALDLKFTVESKDPIRRPSANKEQSEKAIATAINIVKVDLDTLLSEHHQ